MRERVLEAYGKLPISFDRNAGQTDANVRFFGRLPGFNLFMTPTEAVLDLRAAAPPAGSGGSHAGRRAVVRMKFVSANPNPRLTGVEELPGRINYFQGNDPTKWRSNVPTYRQVKYQALYPGIDLVYYGNQRQLEYDFVVAPGASPKNILLEFAGAERLEVDARGDLLIHTTLGPIRQPKPSIYQAQSGARQAIAGGYKLVGRRRLAFQVASYDQSKPLIIDPVLVYSTYVGGTGIDEGLGMDVDPAGNTYVTGHTYSVDFPTTAGVVDASSNGADDAFVTKLDPTGAALVYSTYLGGSGSDAGYGIAVDAAGNAYVAGYTLSANFPTTPGAFDTTYNGGGTDAHDAFVTKLNPTGAALVYSTYLGGNTNLGGGGADVATAIAVDATGNAYVTGFTDSGNFPTTAGAFDPTYNGGSFGGIGPYDGFVTKLNPTGAALVYSTYLGGANSPDWGYAIAVDMAGSAYVAGYTRSADFPTTAGAFDTTINGGYDAFVTKLNHSGASLAYSTYLGGSSDEIIVGVAMDPAGDAYVTGRTISANFPTTAGAFDSTYNGGDEVFVTRLHSTGASLVYSTYLGGGSNEFGSDIAVDAMGAAWVTGSTTSTNFPTTVGAFDTVPNGGSDAFVAKLHPSGTSLVYSTYLGGSGDEGGSEIVIDSAGYVFVTGSTSSANFPTTGTFDATFNGVIDAFVAKIAIDPPDGTPPVSTISMPAANAHGWYNTDVSVTISATDVGSGVKEIRYRLNAGPEVVVPGSTAQFIIATEGTTNITYYANDNTGNTETAREAVIQLDKTPPAVAFGSATPPANAAGWNNTDVAIPFTASDALSGVGSTSPASPLALSTQGVGISSAVTVTDKAGNTATFTSSPVKIDKTPPAILIATPVNGASYLQNVAMPSGYTCSDALSGIAAGGCAGPVVSGASFSSSPIGAKTFPVIASDLAGNAVSLAAGYTVVASGTLKVKFVVHAIQDETSRPRVSTSPVGGAEVRVFTRRDACTDGLVVSGQPKIWGKIYDGPNGPADPDPGCPVVSYGSGSSQYFAKGITDANGQVSIVVPPTQPNTDYVVIGRSCIDSATPICSEFDNVQTMPDVDSLYSGRQVNTVSAGDNVNAALKRVRMFSGKRVPARYLEEVGSYLAIIEPEYVDWTGDVEKYPFVLEAVEDWNVTTTVVPPEGFVSDYPSLTAQVNDTTSAVQFTMTDVGSDWTKTRVTYTIRHKGKTKVQNSEVKMFDKKPKKPKNK